MRFLTYDGSDCLQVTRNLTDDDLKPYAILSHTWGKDEEEVTFRDIGSAPYQEKLGYTKIKFCGQQARQDGLHYFWVDTCCIDKADSTELSTAITSMYRWYQQAQVCYVYLADVSSQSTLTELDWRPAFRKSRWFTRGWTLQELLAPRAVVFYSKEWDRLGTKDGLKELLCDITSIPAAALEGHLSQFPDFERMRWVQGRRTRVKEDQAYCLLGIFGVYMPLIYGEGDNAFRRLQKKLEARSRGDGFPSSHSYPIPHLDNRQAGDIGNGQRTTERHASIIRSPSHGDLPGTVVDPYATFAAACNALQLVGLVKKLIRKTIEYSSMGGATDHRALQDLFQWLYVSIAHWQRFLERSKTLKQDRGAVNALIFAMEDCLSISQEIYALSNELKLDRACTLWRSVRLALRSQTTMEKFQTLSGRHERARASLVLSLLVYLHAQSPFDDATRPFEYQAVRYQLAEVNRETKYTYLMASNINELTRKFRDLSYSDAALRSTWTETVRMDTLCLQPVASHLITYFTQSNDELRNAVDKMDQATQAMVRDTRFRTRILESLVFEKMNSRRDRVQRAHRSTYRWLFKHKQDDSLWHDFVTWLCANEEDRVYWISGKPGSGKTTLMRELDEFLSLRMTAGDHIARIPSEEGLEWLRTPQDGRKDLKSLGTGAISDAQSDRRRPESDLELEDEFPDDLSRELQDWTRSEKVVIAKYYFWCAGDAEEQSVQGLLRCLTHQLLLQRPDLIDLVVPLQLWQAASTTVDGPIQWNESDLVATLTNFIHLTRNNDRILLLIDGLDECGNDDQQREHLLELIHSITNTPHVKACVASRPWNIFRDAFRDNAQLRLEDLTQADIELFVGEKIGQDRNFQHHSRFNEGLLEEITRQITHGARGVFLWVHLVIRDLLRVLRDGGRPSDLLRELERMPRTLDDYFQRMIESIDSLYQRDAAMILLAALCKMDYESDEDDTLWSGPNLLLIHLDYLSPDCAIDLANERDIESAFHNSRGYLLESLDRRLASRCMGLLEIDTFTGGYIQDGSGVYRFQTSTTGDDRALSATFRIENARIEFLHRTVRDFLSQPSSKQMLRRYAGERFDAHWFRCNMLVLDAAAYHHIGRLDLWANAVTCFCRQIVKSTPSESTFRLYELMFDILQYHTRDLGMYALKLPMRTFAVFAEAAAEWSYQRSTAMSLAIQLRWKPYIQSRIKQQMIEEKRGRSLLEYALRPSYSGIIRADPEIVSILLGSEANPDHRAFEWTDIPTWAFYLQALQYPNVLDDRSSEKVICALLARSCRLLVSRHQLLSISKELCRRPLTDSKYDVAKIFKVSDETSALCREADSTISSRLRCLFPALFIEDGDQLVYSAMDMLRSLAWITGDDKGQSLFDEASLTAFKEHLRIPPGQDCEADSRPISTRASKPLSPPDMPSKRGFASQAEQELALVDVVAAQRGSKRYRSNSTLSTQPTNKYSKQYHQDLV